MRVSFDPRIGCADNSHEERLSTSAARLAGDLERKSAPASEDGQRRT
jgi:hypothetical protein